MLSKTKITIILVTSLLLPITTYSQEPIKLVTDFYENWIALSKLSRFDDSNAQNLECILNSFAEGGNDCENKSLISLPREFQLDNAGRGSSKTGVSLGPYLSIFEEFIEKNSAKMTIDHPVPIASIKSIGDDNTPSYYCFVVPKKYTWGNGKSRVLNDTVWVKSTCNKISGIRNEFGGSRQVPYNDTISTATLTNYSSSELEISAQNLYYAGKYKEAFKIFKALGLRNFENTSAQAYTAYIISEDRFYGISKKFAENLMFWLAAKNFDTKDSHMKTLASLSMFKYTDNKKHKTSYLGKDNLLPRPDDFPYGKEYDKLSALTIYEKPVSNGLMLTMNNNDKHQMGYMNESGKMVIPYKYKQAHTFSNEGLALVTEDNIRWKFIDIKGNDAMPLTFDGAIHNFVNGRTYITKNKVAMLINTKGEIIKKIPGYNTVSPFMSLKKYAILYKDRAKREPFDVYDFKGNLIAEGCSGYKLDTESGEIEIKKDNNIVLTDQINW